MSITIQNKTKFVNINNVLQPCSALMNEIRITFQGKSGEDTHFYSELRAKVKKYFEENNISTKANQQMVIKSYLLLLFTFGSYFLILSNLLPVWGKLFLTFCMGTGIAGIGFCIAHDAMHGAYSHSTKINKWLSLTMDLAGSSTYTWHLKHNLSHHSFTNIHHFDEDIRGVKLIRFSPYARFYPFHRYQHLYGFFLYAFVYLNVVFIYNFQQLFQKEFGAFRKIIHPASEVIKMILWKLFFVFYTIVVPLMILNIPLWQFVLGFLSMSITAGVILGLIFNLAHIVEETNFPLPDQNQKIANTWAIHQLETTNNFAPENKLLTWYCGGLNYQIEHHLFPHICSVHYPAISKIVKETALKYGLPYHSHSTLFQALVSHYKMLKKLSIPPIRHSI